jgi:hypothetical protein
VPEDYFSPSAKDSDEVSQRRLRETRKICHEPRCGLAVGQCRLTSGESRARGWILRECMPPRQRWVGPARRTGTRAPVLPSAWLEFRQNTTSGWRPPTHLRLGRVEREAAFCLPPPSPGTLINRTVWKRNFREFFPWPSRGRRVRCSRKAKGSKNPNEFEYYQSTTGKRQKLKFRELSNHVLDSLSWGPTGPHLTKTK